MNLRREDLSSITGLGSATLGRLENDQGGSSRATLLAIANALCIYPSELLADWAAELIDEAQFLEKERAGSQWKKFGPNGLEPTSPPVARSPLIHELPRVDFMATDPDKGTPVLGEVTAGGMVESIVFESGDEPERVPLVYPGRTRVYALRIRGDSMAPEYRPGEILMVQDAQPEELVDGTDAVIQCNGGGDGCSTFKRVIFLNEGTVRLMPLNPLYGAIDCPVEHIIRIGKILGVYRPMGK